MKKIFIYIGFPLAFLLFGVSCDDYLDEMPDNRTEIDTKEKIRSLLISAYPSASHCLVAEQSSDNVDDNGSTWSYTSLEEQAYKWQDVTEQSTDSPHDIWDEYYSATASSNMALEAIEEMGDSKDLAALKAEALITRAYNHFMLANLFCKAYSPKTSNTDLGIPYITASEKEVRPHYERGTVAGVYEMIEKDILAAIPNIDDNLYDIPKYHFNKQAAYAFAARFYLYYGKYDKAIEYADKVLGANPKAILRDWADLMSSSDELVVGYNFTNTNHNCNLLNVSANSLWGRIGGYADAWGMRFSHNIMITRTEGMLRRTIYTGEHAKIYGFTGWPKRWMFKMIEFWEYTDPIVGSGYAHTVHPVFNTDETLLCRAEAYIMKKEYAKAAQDIQTFAHNFYSAAAANITDDYIDQVYGSAMAYYKPDAPTPKKELNPDFEIEKGGKQESMLHCLLHMRRNLTLHEGYRWFDIKRFGIEIVRRETTNVGENFLRVLDTLTKDDPRRAMQIPSDAVDAGLEPNPR